MYRKCKKWIFMTMPDTLFLAFAANGGGDDFQ